VLEDLPNPPEKGYYNFSFDVNPEQEGGYSTGQMPIGDVGPQVNRTAGTLTHPSGAAGPGFTAVVAVVAILAAALLAGYRD
jgi:PGF-CTERM protein